MLEPSVFYKHNKYAGGITKKEYKSARIMHVLFNEEICGRSTKYKKISFTSVGN